MKTEEIKKQEELTDEQLDYVAGGAALETKIVKEKVIK
jgi:hypothetical protein